MSGVNLAGRGPEGARARLIQKVTKMPTQNLAASMCPWTMCGEGRLGFAFFTEEGRSFHLQVLPAKSTQWVAMVTEEVRPGEVEELYAGVADSVESAIQQAERAVEEALGKPAVPFMVTPFNSEARRLTAAN